MAVHRRVRVKRVVLPCLVVAACWALTGCVDLTAVNNFAKESSEISANSNMLDDTAAQSEARDYAISIGKDKAYQDPRSPDFQAHLEVTKQALAALNGYMSVLDKLSSGAAGDISSDLSSIQSGLQSLHIESTSSEPIAKAVGALTNAVLNGIVSRDVAKLVTSAGGPIDQVTSYLIDQAQTTKNTYIEATAADNTYWNTLAQQVSDKSTFCGSAKIRDSMIALFNKLRAADANQFAQKVEAADVAVKAFEKIRTDNAALAASVDHLDAKQLVSSLKNDEPALLSAIHSLQTI